MTILLICVFVDVKMSLEIKFMETSSEVYFKASQKNLNMRTVRRLRSLSDLLKASSANIP